MKEKSVTFTKGKNKFLQNHRESGWLFCEEFKSLLSKLMFTDSAIAMEFGKRKTRSYHQKLNVQIASWVAEQFRTYDLGKWGAFKAVYLSFHWLTRGFELGTCGFELVTRGFELKSCGFELVTSGFELVTRGFELVTCGFEHALLNFSSRF